jgi:3',5'-cyclic AMP phosphodiesterase CpdA
MRILIVSDLHANLEAVEALPKDFDRLWVLGDLVNYGPDPKEVVEFVRENASAVIRAITITPLDSMRTRAVRRRFAAWLRRRAVTRVRCSAKNIENTCGDYR